MSQITARPPDEVVSALDQLAEHPHVGKLLKGGLSGLRRIRVGGYRVIYEINDAEIVIKRHLLEKGEAVWQNRSLFA